MIKLTKPSLVVFDLDNTLYDYEATNQFASSLLIENISVRTKIRLQEVNNALTQARINVKNRLGSTASSHSRLLYISEAFRILDLRPNPSFFIEAEEIFWEAFLRKMKIFEGAKELIQEIQLQRIQIALVTDLTSQIQYRKIAALNLNDVFDFFITSEEVGSDKSTGKAFNLLFNRIKKQPDMVWFIGDGPHDFSSELADTSVFLKRNVQSNKRHMKNQINYIELHEITKYLKKVLDLD
jgi:putative hydrolase of the HAD superfamily